MALQPACPLVEAWGITDRGDCSPAGHPSLVVAGGTAPCTGGPAAPSQPDRGHSDPPGSPPARCFVYIDPVYQTSHPVLYAPDTPHCSPPPMRWGGAAPWYRYGKTFIYSAL
ncbi:hypothetical protein KIL84_001888 [Mauremys mutica]|uniref:Uncharacterized protein n=1 Tax=Mauremys mutica TaxID=74926 RepID=A0A9D3XG79_9SAUR|nr:hypothetical protein KIL84_001888 [Mauremys mutica]